MILRISLKWLLKNMLIAKTIDLANALEESSNKYQTTTVLTTSLHLFCGENQEPLNE